MSWCKELFGHEKPVIALLHLNAFPGDPLYKKGDSMKKPWKMPAAICTRCRMAALTAFFFQRIQSAVSERC